VAPLVGPNAKLFAPFAGAGSVLQSLAPAYILPACAPPGYSPCICLPGWVIFRPAH